MEFPTTQPTRKKLEFPTTQSTRKKLEFPTTQSMREKLEFPTTQSMREKLEFPTTDAPEGMMHAWFSKKSYDLSLKYNKHYVFTGRRVVNGQLGKFKMREMTFSPVTIYTNINGLNVETTHTTSSSNPPSFEDVEYRGIVLVPNL